MHIHHTVILPFLFFALVAHAQQEDKRSYALHGSIGSDVMFTQSDSIIGAKDYDEFARTNTYVNLNFTSKYVDAGARFEYLQYPLPGFAEIDADFAGAGIGNVYATGKYKNMKLTLGDFYDQFGSGLIFRTYEERTLGIDNSLRGARFAWQTPAVQVKALGGQQRRYWSHNDGLVWGADAELNLDQLVKPLQNSEHYLMLGASFVSRHQSADEVITVDAYNRLNLPENVGAADFRTRYQHGGLAILAEYACKANDPSFDNKYIYKSGNAVLVSASYSKTGYSALFQAKRADNMSFRSQRSDLLTASMLNHLPAFVAQQTYSLATLYPYSTQKDGEWAFQANFSYNFKRRTPLGGKYGTTVKINASHIRGLDKKYIPEAYDAGGILNDNLLKGTDGYTASFFGMSKELYYQDLSISIDKKLTQAFKLNAMYLLQQYNPKVVVKEPEDIITAHIFVLEGKYVFNPVLSLRAETQYLLASPYTGEADVTPIRRSNQGNWFFQTLELSWLPHFMFTLSDMYNAGSTREHYYKALVSFTAGAHFIQAGYGRTKAGYDCSGGVCREVPASKGFLLSYHYNF